MGSAGEGVVLPLELRIEDTSARAAEQAERLRAVRERYRLVEDTFRPAGRPVVRGLWSALNDERPSDVALARRLEQTLRREVSPAYLPLLRHRLRQRLGVLFFVLDEVPKGRPDLDGDASLLEWVEERWGWEKESKGTLRGLASLARASADERTLGWALLSRILVNGRKPPGHSDYDVALTLVRLSARSDDAEVKRRLDLWSLWASEDAHLAVLRRLSQLTGAYRTFLPACWYLSCLRGMRVERILGRLRPLESEQNEIKYIVAKLEARR